jgi:hypothetical protein
VVEGVAERVLAPFAARRLPSLLAAGYLQSVTYFRK